MSLPPRVPCCVSVQAIASKDMERQASRHDSSGEFNRGGTGTLAVRQPHRDVREANVSHTNSASRMAEGHMSLSDQEITGGRDRRGTRENVPRGGSGGSGGSGGGYTDEVDVRGGGLRGGERGTRIAERVGGAAMARGKRGRSADADRGGMAMADNMGFEGDEDGDPSQAFDSKRMRQPDMPVLPDEGSSRLSAARGYSPSHEVGRWRDDVGRRGGGGGRMQMPSRDVHIDRSAPYDGRVGGGVGGGRDGGAARGSGRQQSGMHMNSGGGGSGFAEHGYRGDSRGLPHMSEDMDERGSRDSKRGRHERDRASNSRARDDGDGAGRKEKKKSSKSKRSKDKRKN